MKKKLIVLSSLVMGLTPVLAFATQQTSCATAQTGTIPDILCKIGGILNVIIPIIIILGVVYFIWGVITYVIAGDEEAKKSGRDRMIYGIIGLAVIVAMWGLVNILISSFGLTTNTTYTIPTTQLP